MENKPQTQKIHKRLKTKAMIYTHTPRRHFAFPFRIKFHPGKVLRLKINLSANCWYDEKEQSSPGWNKIGYWFSIHHHWNGVTFVWRPAPEKDTFLIGWYGWQKGVSPMATGWDGSQSGEMQAIKADDDELMSIEIGKNTGSMWFETSHFTRMTMFRFRPLFFLSPSFGGQSKPGKKCTLKVEVI